MKKGMSSVDNLMKAQIAFQNILKEEFEKKKKLNSRYSLRGFSKKLEINYGTLSSILSGKRNVSRKQVEKIFSKLNLDPQSRNEVLKYFSNSSKKKTIFDFNVEEKKYLSNLEKYEVLNDKQNNILAQWEYYAVMSLLNCSDFTSSFDWIANRLGISKKRSAEVINKLILFGLIKVENKNWIRTNKRFRVSDDKINDYLKIFHSQSFSKAKESLYRDNIYSRDFSSITMAINPNKISKAKELIRKLEDEIAEVLEVDQKTEVYRLSIQLFPLTKIK